MEGAKPAGIHVIVEGRVKVVRTSRAGREQVLHEDGPGATLGEVPVFDESVYLGSAVAVEDSTLLLVPAAPLLSVVERHPEIARQVIKVLSARLRKFAVLAADLSFSPVTARVARYLATQAERSPTIVLSLTRAELAAHLGTVREEISRALSELVRRGAIEVHGRQIRVLDSAKLINAAEPN